MQILTTLINHGLPIFITIVAFCVMLSLAIGTHYHMYVALLSEANTDVGKERFAKYLARRAGGRKIDNNNSWSSFIPAAEKLHKQHSEKRHLSGS